MGKALNEIETYVDFNNAEKSVDNKGTVYTFEKSLSNYQENAEGTESWHFNKDNELSYINVHFSYASDTANFTVLDAMEASFGKYIENKNSEVGIAHYYWLLPSVDITQTYNYVGSDESRDDGIVDLHIVISSKEKVEKESSDTEKETESETKPQTEENTVVYTDKLTTRVVQEALNSAGYNCGTPDVLDLIQKMQ